MLRKYFRLRKYMNRKERKLFMRFFLNNEFNNDIESRFKQGFTAHKIVRLDDYSDQQIEAVGRERLYYCETQTMFTSSHFFYLKGYHPLHLAKMIVSAEMGSKKELIRPDKERVKYHLEILKGL